MVVKSATKKKLMDLGIDENFAHALADDRKWDMPTSRVRVFQACNSSGLSSTILKLSVVTPGTCWSKAVAMCTPWGPPPTIIHLSGSACGAHGWQVLRGDSATHVWRVQSSAAARSAAAVILAARLRATNPAAACSSARHDCSLAAPLR